MAAPGQAPNIIYSSHPQPGNIVLQAQEATKLTRRFTNEAHNEIQRLYHAKRDATLTEDPPQASTLLTGRQQLFERLQRRLLANGVATAAHLDIRLLNWILPFDKDQLELWDRVLDSPLLVSHVEVNQLFELRESGPGSPRPPDHEITLYLRTYAYVAEELLATLNEMIRLGFGLTETASGWKEMLDSAVSEGSVEVGELFYVRFQGQTMGMRAYDRMLQDRTNAPAWGRKFLQVTESLFPGIVNGCLIQEFVRATVSIKKADPQIADLREQLLIACFEGGSLNVAIGGVRPTFQPRQEDEQAFATLRCKLLDSMQILLPCPQDRLAHIRTYTERCTKFANNNPLTTGTKDPSFVITQEIEDVRYEEAIFRVMPETGWTPFLLLGSDLPKDFARDPRPWVTQQTTSADILRHAFNWCGSWERTLGTFDDTITSQLFKQNLIPHVDFFPWFNKHDDDTPAALALLRAYLQVASPLVMCCTSASMFGAATDGFRHRTANHSVGPVGYMGIIGQPKICWYRQMGDSSLDDCVLVMPCLHPGAPGHSQRALEALIRLFLLGMAAAWFASHTAMRYASSGLSKYQVLVQVKKTVERTIAPNTVFGRVLEDAKREAREERRESLRGQRHMTGVSRAEATKNYSELKKQLAAARRLSSSLPVTSAPTRRFTDIVDPNILILQARKTMWTRAQEEATRIVRAGFALGRPRTLVRQRDIEQHSNQWMVHYSAETGETHDAWERWALDVEENSSYMIEAADLRAEVPNLLQALLMKEPTIDASNIGNLTVEEFERAEALLRQFFQETGVTTLETLADSFFELRQILDPELHSDIGRAVVVENTADEYISFFDGNGDLSNGVEVEIVQYKKYGGANPALRNGINWRFGNQRYSIDDFRLPASVMSQQGQVRLMYFVPQGIDIRDQEGNSLGITGRNQVVTIPVSDMLLAVSTSPNRELFLRLWEIQSGSTVNAALAELNEQSYYAPPIIVEPKVVPTSFFAGRQTDIENLSNWNESARKALLDLRPYQPGDMMYLIYQFLEKYYPRGQPFETSLEFSNLGWADSVWAKAIAFCMDPKWSKHPKIRNLQAMAVSFTGSKQSKKAATSTMMQACRVLRPSNRTGEDSRQTNDGVITMYLGRSSPAGTISTIPVPNLLTLQEDQDQVDMAARELERYAQERQGRLTGFVVPADPGGPSGTSEGRPPKRPRIEEED